MLLPLVRENDMTTASAPNRVAMLVALATMLVWASPSQALPPDGPRQPPDCAADITGQVTATPPSIDREASTNLSTTLTWSVAVPKGCPVATTVSLGGVTVAHSGKKAFSVTKTTTFALVLDLPRFISR